MATLKVTAETWPIRGRFAISRGARTHVEVVLVELSDGELLGRGECVPYAHYGESNASVIALIEGLREDLAQGLDLESLQTKLPSGAARNALDCALWDLHAKRNGKRAWELAGIPAMAPLTTAYTLSLDTPEKMHSAARDNAQRPLLKLKLAGDGDLERVEAVHAGAPDTRLIVDANEGWSPENYQHIAPQLAALGVEMIEQPFPAGNDSALSELPHPLSICADEACHDRASLADIVGKYDMINIKLDKTGGLTEALKLRAEAEAAGLKVMVGCMLATSLAMAPAMIVGQGVAVVDLDGPLLLDKDREFGINFDDNLMQPPVASLWG
jgi:L-alanine-DL-glutamate epimerase-like enolase superfamily enzyme